MEMIVQSELVAVAVAPDQGPKTRLNWTFNLDWLYTVWSSFWKLRVQSELVVVVVAPDQGPETRLNWTFKP